jgi:hypothetical protein
MKMVKGLVKPQFKYIVLCIVLLLSGVTCVNAQKAVTINKDEKQHIFSYNEIEAFEDVGNKLNIQQVSDSSFNKNFLPSPEFIPKNYHYKSTYWYRIKIKNKQATKGEWILEFYDQTIDHISFFIPNKSNGYTRTDYGASLPFAERLLNHKNFTISLEEDVAGEHVYYFSLQSQQPANVMIVLKPLNWFIQYGLKEYFFSGIFYGMTLVFCLYNLVMFFAIRQRKYLYYILYNFSIGVFEMSSNGFAFQYLWPNSPGWNEIAFGVSLYVASLCSLLFTRDFLYLRAKAPVLNKIIIWIISLRSVFFLLCLFINHHWFIYKFIDAVPLLFAFYAGVRILRKGYHPARFFVAGYFFLLLGFSIRVLKTLASYNFPFGPINFYSLSFCFLMEMLFVSFAIGDQVRWLKKKKDLVQKRMMEEMRLNQELKDNLNKELEIQVKERTKELMHKSAVIEQQNEELVSVNDLLKHQSEEILRMNAILAEDNQELQVNIKKVTQARVMSADMSFDEFSKIYTDDAACSKFLADLKWQKDFKCRKCGNSNYFQGHLPYSKRCSKCSYEESATTNTIFKNAHIPLNKAFYMVYIVYTTKGKISSYKLSEILSIRQSTCWSYSSKVKKLMEERKKELQNAGEKGWSKLVLE